MLLSNIHIKCIQTALQLNVIENFSFFHCYATSLLFLLNGNRFNLAVSCQKLYVKCVKQNTSTKLGLIHQGMFLLKAQTFYYLRTTVFFGQADREPNLPWVDSISTADNVMIQRLSSTKVPRLCTQITSWQVEGSYCLSAWWAALWTDEDSPCLTKVWLVSSRMSQPSTIILSMARFFRMFSVSLTSSCITLIT